MYCLRGHPGDSFATGILDRDIQLLRMLALDLSIGPVHHYGLAALVDLCLAGSGKSGPNALAGRIGWRRETAGYLDWLGEPVLPFTASEILSKVVSVTDVTIAKAENDAGNERMSFDDLSLASISSPNWQVHRKLLRTY